MNGNEMSERQRVRALESQIVKMRMYLALAMRVLDQTPKNARLVTQRVSVMKLILKAQTEIDRQRSAVME